MPDLVLTRTTAPLKAPFPWYGGKSLAAALIWAGLGDVQNFVEPFAGALGTLLGRPTRPGIETINDLDAYVCNVWRALQADPEACARFCDFPVNEAQQHAVHTWLVGQRETFTARVMGDPDYYDAQVAGRWLYGISCWIGGGWCSGAGPWQSIEDEAGHRQLVHLGNTGRGVHRRRVHLGNTGRGVHRRRVHLGNTGQEEGLYGYFAALQARLRHVRVCCGDWTRVLGPSVTWKHGLTGILLDPPYGEEEDRDLHLYAVDSRTVARDVRAWCLEHGRHPLLRVVLCGYGETHDELLAHGWSRQQWTANGGYGLQGNGRGRANKERETLWLSPYCLQETMTQLPLFA